MATVCRFQIARHLAKGRDILELTGLPGFLLPVGSKTDVNSQFNQSTHIPADVGGSQAQQDVGIAAPAAEAPRGFAMSRSEGSRKSARIDSGRSGANDTNDKA